MNSSSMTIKQLCAVLAVILCACGVALMFGRLATASDVSGTDLQIGADNAPQPVIIERFEKIAKEKGGVYAYNVLREAKLAPGIQVHTIGHKIGEVLYTQKGVAAMTDCTPEFGNACSHAIVIEAYIELGDGALPLIKDACNHAPGGLTAYNICYHGLGHGVIAYYEYSLEKAIGVCKQVGTELHGQQEYRECVGGAIMELLSGGGHDKSFWVKAREKYLTPADPLSPCMSSVVPDDARDICLMYITPRLFQEASGVEVPSENDPPMFQKAFRYCEVIPQSSGRERQSCYEGFGKEFASYVGGRDVRLLAEGGYSDEQIHRIDDWCGLAGNSLGHTACDMSALGALFWGGEHDPSTSFRFCNIISDPAAKEACFSSLATNIVIYIREGDARNKMCTQLPEPHRARCLAGKRADGSTP